MECVVNILFIVLNTVGKGTYWRALRLGQSLVAEGHAVSLIAASQKSRIGIFLHVEDGVTVVETPDLFTGALRSGWDLWNIINRIAWISKRRFDIVHAFETRPTVLFPALYTKYYQKTLLIIDWADWFGRGGSVEERPNRLARNLLRPIETFFEERFRNQANATTVICGPLLERAIELGIPSEQILLLPNGTDVKNVPLQNKAIVRQRLGLPQDMHLIAYTGAIFQGDAELMSVAFDRVQTQLPNTRLLLIGYCNRAIEAMVQSPDSVIRTGPVNYKDLVDYIAACDVGWLPLRNTNANRGRFPMKAHDFMTAGRPIVATDVGDLGQLLRQYSIGSLADDTSESLTKSTIELLNCPTLQISTGMEARRIAETEYSWLKIAQELIEFYQSHLS